MTQHITQEQALTFAVNAMEDDGKEEPCVIIRASGLANAMNAAIEWDRAQRGEAVAWMDPEDGLIIPASEKRCDCENSAFYKVQLYTHPDAVNAKLVEALSWALARVERLAPHHAAEGDASLYEIAAARAAIAATKGQS